jgi:hypothetical protein
MLLITLRTIVPAGVGEKLLEMETFSNYMTN